MPGLYIKSEYDVRSLVDNIGNGEIGLPKLQRAFIWPSKKVRDLFDSMYKGYPVGNLMLWKERRPIDYRPIGYNQQQNSPSLLILDGQQRLTSLFAVVKGKEVLRDNLRKELIKIAFDPLKEEFKVADASTTRSSFFINNISDYFTCPEGNHEFINSYLENLSSKHDLSDNEKRKIASSLNKLWALTSYSFTAIVLDADIEEEEAAEIFVRVNSKGIVLKQADFILTLLSIHWDEGRAQIEEFCSNALINNGRTSPFNYFINPTPDQLLRVIVGYGFKRARLKYIYQILLGKDLETGEITIENRNAQFEIYKIAQSKTLNDQTWHDFLTCISSAGYLCKNMISSENTLLYCYALYLIGKYEYNVSNRDLHEVMKQWFFMSSITRRYTSSPESQFEKDISILPAYKTPSEFVNALSKRCDVELTNDFWSIKLPNELITTSTTSPAFCAYQAALVILDAKALFSDIKVSTLLNPATSANRSIEKHHLFPKEYLNRIGISDDRRRNQVANLTLVWWSVNMDILDKSPSSYIEQVSFKPSSEDLELHALPDEWVNLEYDEFLDKRRFQMANVIREAYEMIQK